MENWVDGVPQIYRASAHNHESVPSNKVIWHSKKPESEINTVHTPQQKLEVTSCDRDENELQSPMIDEHTSILEALVANQNLRPSHDPDDTNMDSAVHMLWCFYVEQLAPLLKRKSQEPLDWVSNSALAEGYWVSMGANCLESLRNCLKSAIPGQNFQNTELILVREALHGLSVLYKHGFITQDQVKEFFTERITIKLVGRHLVAIYGEEYPKFSKLVNFKPDMKFLKKDFTTSDLHWWLNVIDKPTEGKILWRSMQALFILS
ncbi:hypothetical protein PGTUg99_022925 [Puccinia graminis f. sp. tritici]|uniref:Uncharacterized protein n=1 Tax=Puccinia graminis f. sp. tritici TaxID=56615 RepID=A0A5B0LKQ1_PUCGR|nr:hypothetical protein PGTUg99_022925 [Puccinia graminis f. sp. tritici]